MSKFTGFPHKGLSFLKDLEANNNKQWFEENQKVYESQLVTPALAFITGLGKLLQERVSPDIVCDTRTDGSGCMFPIDQGEGLSSGTVPYKTYFDMFFWEGPGAKAESPGYYFCISPDGAFIFGGWPMMCDEVIKKYRDAVADDDTGSRLSQIVSELKKAGYGVGGGSVEKVPPGFPPDHPRAVLLRYLELFAQSPAIPVEVVTTSQLTDVCLEHARNMNPILRWLVELRK